MRGTAGAFRYLLARSFWNRAHVQLRRVKSPRYALGFLVGALYLWNIFRRGGVYTGTRGLSPASGLAAADDFTSLAIEALLVLSTLATWIFGGSEPALAFTPADVQLLFPAPVSRRTLVRYKLVQAQFSILFSVLVWTVLLERGPTLPPVLPAIAIWVAFTTLYLHRVGASFVKVRAAQHAASTFRRLAIVGAVIAATAWGVVASWPAISAALADNAPDKALFALRRSPAIQVVLWPFHALLAPLFARTIAAWTQSIAWALAILGVCYLWVMRSAVGFEEAAMQRAERLAAQRATRRTRGAAPLRADRPLFPLSPTGRPWVAIVWKNLTAFQRIAAPGRALLIAAMGIIAVAIFAPKNGVVPMIFAGGSFFGILWCAILGAFTVRVDLQQDMLRLQLLKAYPLSGAALVGAEIGGTVVILGALELAFLMVGAVSVLFVPARAGWGDVGIVRVLPGVVAALIALPAITALRVAVANAWAVLLPGWVQLGPERVAGIEAMGQNLLAVAGSMFAHLFLLLLPAIAGLGLLLAFSGTARTLTWPIIPAAIAFAAVAAAELWLMVRWLGGVFARTDPGAVEAVLA